MTRGTIKPYPFQRDDLDTLREAGYVALLNMEPGAGKTVTAVYAAVESGAGSKLIIAPLSTHDTAWGAAVKDITGENVRLIGTATKAQREALMDLEFNEPGWYLATPQWFTRADISSWFVDMAIVDEVHMLGAPGKAGQRKLSGYNKKDSPLSTRATYRLALSGTPARNNFERMWSIMRFLWPVQTTENYYAWLAANMKHHLVNTGRKLVKKWTTERKPGALIANAPCVLQHFRRARCCKHHPDGFLSQSEPQVLRRVVQLSAAQKKAVHELETQYLTMLDDDPLVVDIPLTLQQRIRQLCLGVPEFNADDELTFSPEGESPFAEELLSILENLDEGEPVMVFMESQRFASALTKRLVAVGYSAFEFSGATVKDRAKKLAEFGSTYQVCVGVLSAIGTGTDGAQKVANTEVWMERSLDITVNVQAEARLDRMGARAQVQRYVISDDHGYADGRFSKEVERRRELALSLQNVVD